MIHPGHLMMTLFVELRLSSAALSVATFAPSIRDFL